MRAARCRGPVRDHAHAATPHSLFRLRSRSCSSLTLALWPGGGEAICPTGGIVNNVIMQCLHAQFAHEMCRRDQPPIWRMGIYRTRGREFNSFADWLLESRGF